MSSSNDITGDKLVTKVTSESYRDGWSRIFSNKSKATALNIADLKDRLHFLDQESFCYDKATNEFLGAPGVCPPPANVYVWVDGRGACSIKDLYFDPTLGIIININ